MSLDPNIFERCTLENYGKLVMKDVVDGNSWEMYEYWEMGDINNDDKNSVLYNNYDNIERGIG